MIELLIRSRSKLGGRAGGGGGGRRETIASLVSDGPDTYVEFSCPIDNTALSMYTRCLQFDTLNDLEKDEIQQQIATSSIQEPSKFF